MNMKEILELADHISRMRYSIGATRSSYSYALALLNAFPMCEKDVHSFDEIYATERVANVYKSRIAELATSMGIDWRDLYTCQATEAIIGCLSNYVDKLSAFTMVKFVDDCLDIDTILNCEDFNGLLIESYEDGNLPEAAFNIIKLFFPKE